jgi:transcriptional regulator with XRE-family HTH domain
MRSNSRGTQRTALKAGNPGQHIPRELRGRLGMWFKEAREQAGLTQVDLADSVGLKPTSANSISAIENGRNNIPQELYSAFAQALGISQPEFAKVILRHTDPWVYRAVFNSGEQRLLDEIALMQRGNFLKGPEDEAA